MNGDLANFFGTTDGFDTHSVEPQADFVAIPPGDYPIVIEKSEMKKTKSGNGHFLELTCKILALPGNASGMMGQSAVGRKVWDRLNLDNPNGQAVEIALRSFAALGQALNLARIQDTQQIVGGMCIACVKVKDGSNEIRTYKPLPTAGIVPPITASVVVPPPASITAPVPVVPGYVPDVAGIVPPNPTLVQPSEQPLAVPPAVQQVSPQVPVVAQPVNPPVSQVAPAAAAPEGVRPWQR